MARPITMTFSHSGLVHLEQDCGLVIFGSAHLTMLAMRDIPQSPPMDWATI
jgi:hypothetical protein